ncbi:nuclear transport factor 2 family protein [Chloroflexota bacterium]
MATDEMVELKREVGRLQDALEIQNLMSRYEYLHTYNDHEAVAGLFTNNQPDCFVNIGTRGYWVGKDAARRAFGTFIKMGPTPSLMPIHPLTTPLIEVAGDRKTAKAMWIGTGLVARKENGKPWCLVEWDKYGVDLMKEDGKWKFWHMQIFRIFHINWDQKWSENEPFMTFQKPTIPDMYDDDTKPDGISVNVNAWSIETLQNLVPAPPEPYETWDEKTSYGLPKK